MIALTIGAVMLVPVVDIVDSNNGEVDVENETVTTNASYTETYDLQGFNIVNGSETVERYDSGTDSWNTLSAGTDYELNETNGSVEFLSGGNVSEGDEVRASYTYEATTGTVSTVVGLIPLFLALLLLVPLATKVQDRM